jgi:hypothetical protein
MMQAGGKGTALRPGHRNNAGDSDAAHPGIKKMAGIVAVADFTPAVREPEDIAAPQVWRSVRNDPAGRGSSASRSTTSSISQRPSGSSRNPAAWLITFSS